MEVGARKRTLSQSALDTNGGSKKPKQEGEFFSPGLGGKSKPCSKFFSSLGCPFGDGCHFLHYVPGGLKAVSHMLGTSGQAVSHFSRPFDSQAFLHETPSAPPVKTRLCNKYNTEEGCKFGDSCRFAHGEHELGKPASQAHKEPHFASPPAARAADSFGASATAKISINASLAGAVIGKGGVNSKQIARITGVRLSIRDHETDPKLNNVELEGTFDQIKEASAMVHELILNLDEQAAPPRKMPVPRSLGLAGNYKVKLCDNFAKGTCSFADRCHFAHGMQELRKSVA